MKNFIKIFMFIFVLANFLPLRLYAQSDETTEINDVEALKIEFKEYTQSPESLVVKYEMTLVAGIDSDRVRITWSLTGNSKFTDESQITETISVKKGKRYIVPISIRPTGKGDSELFGQAEAFRADGTVLVSVRKNITTNSTGEIIPYTSEYSSQKSLLTLKNLFLFILIVACGSFGSIIFLKRLARWVNKDERY